MPVRKINFSISGFVAGHNITAVFDTKTMKPLEIPDSMTTADVIAKLTSGEWRPFIDLVFENNEYNNVEYTDFDEYEEPKQ